MAVEARHLRLLPPQILGNREMVNGTEGGNVMGYNCNYSSNNNVYGEPLGYGLLSGTKTTTADTLILAQMYNTTIAGDSIPVKTPMKSDSGLTYSTIPPVVSRKRPRDAASVGFANNHQLLSFPANNNNSNPCGSVNFLGQDFSYQIHQQQSEVDQLIAQYTAKAIREVEEQRKRYSSRIIKAVEEGMMKKLRAKEVEIENMGKLNWALEEKVKSLCVENQIWRELAQSNEATANALRNNLEQLLSQSQQVQQEQSLIDEDAQSCCGSNLVIEEEELDWHYDTDGCAVSNACGTVNKDNASGTIRSSGSSMELAVSDINADPRILNGTQLNLIMEDAECNVFLGSMRAFQVLDDEVVAIIGPQSSSIAHMISQIANGLHVPLISYAATDPTLSALQFPYFLRSTHSDAYQMEAVADLVDYYRWKEVIAIFIDNDYGRNGISVLGDELAKKMAKISYKLALPSQFDPRVVTDALNKSKFLGPRVYVVHIHPDPKLRFFRIAHKLNMMTSNYVWLATDWLSSTLDSNSRENQDSLSILEGVIVFRPYIPPTSLKKAFVSRWRKLQQRDSVHSGLNAYGLYAYDTVWAVARSVHKLLNEHVTISFSSSSILQDPKTDSMQLGKFKVFHGGELLLKILREINFTGLTGQIRFSADRNIIINGYEVVNIVQMGTHTVSYWSNHSGFSLLPPEFREENQTTYSHPDQKIDNVKWPGGMTEKPRGWVIANSGRPLRIGIPKRASFIEFVTVFNNSYNVRGYCIDLFDEARQLVPYDIPFTFVPFGNGLSNPNYDNFVKMVADGVFDAAVGDISIVTNRTRIVDFTQPFAASGLVIVAPIGNSKKNSWVFVKPFASKLWAVIAVSFVIVAVVIWILEHRVNDEFRGPPKQQLITMFLFSFSTLFKTNQERTVSPLSRMVMVIWLFLLMVITSSYTASLTSILTVQQLSTSITGLESLIASDLTIGYQVGSFAYSYLRDNLGVRQSRLVSLGSPEEYEKALRQGPENGGVAAIVDELPYIELFLSKHSDFGIVGQQFSKGGWGFAFQKGSPLAVDMSTAILKLAESGKLQKIHQNWFCKPVCPEERRRNSDPNQLHLSSFWELYFVCGVFSLVALSLFLFRVASQYARYKKRQMESSTPSATISSNVHCSQVLYNFIDFIDEKEEAIKRYFNQHNNSQSQES